MATQSNKTSFLKQLFNRNKDGDTVNKDITNENMKILDYYASLAENHPDLILVFSLTGELVVENRRGINNLLGYSPMEKLDFNKHLTESTFQILKNAFHNALSGKSEGHEVELQRKNGEELHVFLTFIPIKAGDDIPGVYLIIKDNTEQIVLNRQLGIKAAHLNHAQQIAKVGSWEYIIDEDNLYCSDHVFDIFGMEKKEKISMDAPFELMHPDDYKRVYEQVVQSYEGKAYFTEFRIYHGRTKELKYLQVQADVIWNDNEPYKLVGVVKDNTKQKKLELELINRNDSFRHVFDNLNPGFWIKEYPSGQATYLSKGIEEILQIPLEDVYADPVKWRDMILPEQYDEVLERQKLLETGESIIHRYQIQAGDGTIKWIFDQTVPWFNDNGELERLFGIIADISSEMEMQEKLKNMALYDSLTGLPNRESLYEKLESLCKGHQPFALLYIDLDRFNLVNDSLGHQTGDELLKRIAKKLLSLVSTKGYVTRLGSNDFIVILEEFSDRNEITSLVESMIRRIEVPMTINDYELHITASIGISMYPEDGNREHTLLENAHSALYYAKEFGRNNYQFYSNSKTVSSYKKYTLEKDMRKAIVNEEFEIYYQPQTEPVNGLIKGAEALIRWNHHEWGIVSPGEFIAIAEESHLIHDISDWTIRTVCAQLKEWKDKGYHVRPISLNISPLRFLKSGLVELVKEQLELYQIDAELLEFEITEGSLLKNEKQVLSTLGQLRNLGINIVIDDFGTGYASLDYIRKFDATKIKIDQIFIQEMETNHKNAAIVSSILHLAKGLQVEVVAEGVEEMEQLDFLKQKECDLIQGYLFSKPVPLKTFEEMLQTGYLKPKKKRRKVVIDQERRKHFRFQFNVPVLGEMTVIGIGDKMVQLGSTSMLIEDISLKGLKIVSALKLPVNTDMKFRFHFTLMKETFEVEGRLQWKEESRGEIYYYGVELDINENDETRLAGIINKLSVLQKQNLEIPNTEFIYETPQNYYRKK